jgi:hypothetical protein
MERKQIENLYKINGLTDYKLNSTGDILKVHGIDFRAVDGYNRLDDINRSIYEKFIVNIFNAFGLESRSTLIPKGIYFVEQTDLLAKENPEDDYYIVVGGVVMAIDRSGLKSVLYKWEDEDDKHLEVKESESTQYLRFEYAHQGRREWLHVIKDGKEWY